MTSGILDAPAGVTLADAAESRRAHGRPRPRRSALAWAVLALVTIGGGVGFVGATGMHPAYDPYGWLVWGRQAARLSLDTSAAPSWKPLPFLFTLPFTAFGRSALWLWMFTAVGIALVAPVFGALAAYRLTGLGPGRSRLPALIAGGLGGAGVVGVVGYFHFVLIAYADPMMITLTAAAVWAAAAGRPRLTWVLLVLLSLGRPEAIPIALLWGAWAWRGVPSMRWMLGAGLVLIPLLWFGVPAITSDSWLIAGRVLDQTTTPLPGNRLDGVLTEFTGLYELPMQVAVLAGATLAVVMRRRPWLLLCGAILVWLGVDVLLALHGSGVSPRYMYEPAAAAVILAAAAAGRALSAGPTRWSLLRLAAIPCVLALVVGLAPAAQLRARLTHNGILLGQRWTRQLNRLHDAIAGLGGPGRLNACGIPSTQLIYQSIVAWELGRNVSDIDPHPVRLQHLSARSGTAMIYFKPVHAGWRIRTQGRDLPPGCRGLFATTRVD